MVHSNLKKGVLFVSLMFLSSCMSTPTGISSIEAFTEICEDICSQLTIENYDLERDYENESGYKPTPKYKMNCNDKDESRSVTIDFNYKRENSGYYLVFSIISYSRDDKYLDNAYLLWRKYVDVNLNKISNLSELKTDHHSAESYEGETEAYDYYFGKSSLDEDYIRYSEMNEGTKIYLSGRLDWNYTKFL